MGHRRFYQIPYIRFHRGNQGSGCPIASVCGAIVVILGFVPHYVLVGTAEGWFIIINHINININITIINWQNFGVRVIIVMPGIPDSDCRRCKDGWTWSRGYGCARGVKRLIGIGWWWYGSSGLVTVITAVGVAVFVFVTAFAVAVVVIAAVDVVAIAVVVAVGGGGDCKGIASYPAGQFLATWIDNN